jgi:hypothetical protein
MCKNNLNLFWLSVSRCVSNKKLINQNDFVKIYLIHWGYGELGPEDYDYNERSPPEINPAGFKLLSNSILEKSDDDFALMCFY